MTCVQDPLLLKRNIFVDDFSHNGHVFLTHAHKDHLFRFSKKFHGTVYCTITTKRLVQFKYAHKINFIVLEYNRPITLNKVKIHIIPSFHCDGACMFLFELVERCKPLKILYTGDFKWENYILANARLSNIFIHRLYYDDTFENITTSFPTFQETFENFTACFENLDKQYPIFINTSIIGFEPLLRKFTQLTNHKYMLDERISDSIQEKNLIYLLPNEISSEEEDGENEKKSTIILSNRKFMRPGEQWIIPTCTHFLCKQKKFKSKQKKQHYVWFATHSNAQGIKMLKTLVCADVSYPCSYLTKLKC